MGNTISLTSCFKPKAKRDLTQTSSTKAGADAARKGSAHSSPSGTAPLVPHNTHSSAAMQADVLSSATSKRVATRDWQQKPFPQTLRTPERDSAKQSRRSVGTSSSDAAPAVYAGFWGGGYSGGDFGGGGGDCGGGGGDGGGGGGGGGC